MRVFETSADAEKAINADGSKVIILLYKATNGGNDYYFSPEGPQELEQIQNLLKNVGTPPTDELLTALKELAGEYFPFMEYGVLIYDRLGLRASNEFAPEG